MPADNISQKVHAYTDRIVATRRYLHARPETSFNEIATSDYIAERLEAAGFQVRCGIGGTGLIAELQGENPGKSLLIRADIDGLPIDEATDLKFASANGSMHACGHDGHIAMALGAADIISQLRSQLNGKVTFLFQPAEEIAKGALAMIDDGVMDLVDADAIIGTHLWNQIPTGFVGVNQGTVFAGADMFKITVHGFGGHGAMPHLTVDPVAVAAQIINAAQTIVSREIPPLEMGVVTFGSISGGSAANVIADTVEILGTIRSYNPDTHRTISEALQRIARNTSEAMRATARYERSAGTPPVVNNPTVAIWISGLSMQTVGEDAVGEITPISVGDDMAEFMNRIPGVYFILGAKKSGAEGHHNAKFDFDEACLPIGTEIFVRAALDMDNLPATNQAEAE